ncbi:MAG: DUF502 domain-containing protein [Clostridia bacterium]|nr:DUF502 domain-containing protein [Clostridia bacterium]
MRPAGRPGFLHRLRSVLLAGVAALLPVALAVYVVLALFRWVDGLLRPLLAPLFPGDRVVTGAGVLATFLLVLLVGLFVSNYVGSRLWGLVDAAFRRLPVASSIYGTAKQFLAAFTSGKGASFQRVALIEYPRPGLWSLVLISADTPPGLARAAGEDEMVNVFLMTTPNPTTGFLLLVPKRDLRLLDVTVEEAMRMIISGGVVNPERLLSAGEEAPLPQGAHPSPWEREPG